MKKAIVVGMKNTSLGIVWSLGRKGIEVYGIDYSNNSIAFNSKYCKRSLIFPSPFTHPEECLDQFIRLGKSLADKAVLLPDAEHNVEFISKYKTELSQYYHFNIPAADILTNIIDKTKQYKVAEQLGIPIPKTLILQDLDDLKEAHLSYPALVKGASTEKWTTEFHNKGFIVRSDSELKKCFELASNKNLQVVIQEMIIGPNKNHFKVCAYYSMEKELLAIFSTQKTRQFPIDIGIGTYMISGNFPELIELGRKCFEGMGYNGIGSIEFKKDDRDDQYKLIELNPRFWLQNIQATCAGVNFPYIYYLDCIGERVEPVLRFKENIRYWDAYPDLGSFLANRRRGEVSFFEWVKSIFSADCYAYFAWDDLKPIRQRFKQLLDTIYRFMFRKKQG
jgi:predicted ATP-grasp superfamily ATP-dependent carboligase